MNVINTILREVCETDLANPDADDTVCIGVEDLRTILESCLDPDAAPTQGADARPVAIYQFRSEDGSWLDVEKAMYDKYAATPDPVLHRIVYAARDAAPIDAQDAARYRWIRLDRTEDQTRQVLDIIIDNCEENMDEAIDRAIAAIAPREKT